jgi:hypothetical protein
VGILNGEIIGWPHPCTGSYHEVSVTGLDWITERTCTTPGAFCHSFQSPGFLTRFLVTRFLSWFSCHLVFQ